MSKVTWQITGLKDLERGLGELKTATAKNVARRTLKEAGEPLAHRMRALAPKEHGDLIESIDVSTRAVEKPNLAPIEMYVGPGRHPQAITQEFGTWFHSAQPFARPAWLQTHMYALDIIITLLGIEINKAAARARRKAMRGR